MAPAVTQKPTGTPLIQTHTLSTLTYFTLLHSTIKELHSAHIMIEYEDRLGLCCTCRKYILV